MKWQSAILCCLVLAGCYKRETQPREPFTLQGRVVNCDTGEPLAGVRILVEAGPARGGFLSSDHEAGAATTDVNGKFALIPLSNPENETFDLHVDLAGYYGQGVNLYRDEILKAGPVFDYGTLCMRKR